MTATIPTHLMEAAQDAFYQELHRRRSPMDDEADHQEATRAALEAVILVVIGYQGPPDDPRNAWRVIDALGWSREVASEGNAQQKAAGWDRTCPPRECPHRVQHWTGSTWVDAPTATEGTR